MTIVDLHTQRVMEVWHERKRYRAAVCQRS
nr:MAG TPA: hypothetical protein [Caudoviricetes sp.]